METGHYDSKSFWYELKQWIFAKSLITSKKVCIWTRKTFWVFHSLIQVCETIYRYIHRLKLFDNWINFNCCCCWYTLKERNCIETTCIWKDFVSKQPLSIGVCLPRDDAKEKISGPFKYSSSLFYWTVSGVPNDGFLLNALKTLFRLSRTLFSRNIF